MRFLCSFLCLFLCLMSESSAQTIKTVSGVSWANIKTVAGVSSANIKTVSGVPAPTSGGNPGLLDTITNAGFAYSFRKLKSDYAGSCMRVRRESDNAEQDIGFVADTCDRASLETFCSGTTCYVRIWYDQSGNGVDAYGMNEASTNDNLPIIVDAGTTQKDNNRLAIRFDHPRAFYWTNTGVDLTDFVTGGPVNTDKAATFESVCNIGSSAGSPWIVLLEDNIDQTEIFQYYDDGTGQRVEFIGTAAALGGSLTRDQQINTVGQVNGNTFEGFENGTSIGSNTNGSVQETTNTGIIIRIGGGSFSGRNLTGYMQEAIIWKTVESASAIYTSTNGYWAIP